MFDRFFWATAHAGTTFGAISNVLGKTFAALDDKHAARADVGACPVPVTLVVINFDGFPIGFKFWAHNIHAKSLSLTRNQPRINKNLALGAYMPIDKHRPPLSIWRPIDFEGSTIVGVMQKK